MFLLDLKFLLNLSKQRFLTWGSVWSSHVKQNSKYKTVYTGKSALFLGKEFVQILKMDHDSKRE